jgi:predicted small lipoprotein YifL
VRHRVASVVVLLLAISLVGCGRESGVGQQASDKLTPGVQAIRAAAASGDREAATEKLAELRQTVAELRAAGQLSEAGAAKVLAATTDVEVQLAALPPSVESESQGGAPDQGADNTATTHRQRGNGQGQDDDDD